MNGISNLMLSGPSVQGGTLPNKARVLGMSALLCERWKKVQECQRANKTIHLGRVAAMCYEKGSELPENHPERKMRARSVFLGDNVIDQWYQEAEMEGLGAAPPAMEDSRALDAMSCQPGYVQTISDADSAYLQAWLGSKYEVWVEIPREYWLPEWEGKYERPLCLLVLALYGHEDSGGYWEEKSYGDVMACGWVKVRRGVFYKEKENACLMIYVDDFKMVCRKEDVDILWKPIRELISLSEPKEAERYLGCHSKRFTAPVSEFAALLGNRPGLWSRIDPRTGEKRIKPDPWEAQGS